MSENFLGKHYSWFISSLLFLFPIGINTVKGTGDLILVILAISGIVLSIFYKTSPFSIKELRLFNLLTLGYFLVICLSILFSGKASELAHFISRELHFLFAPFVALAIFKAKINITTILYGIKIALILLATLVYVNSGSFDVRYSGVMNADSYGGVLAAMLLMSLSKIHNENLTERIFTSFAFFMGLLALIASGTRGAWLSAILSISVFIWIAYKKGKLKVLFKTLGLFLLTFIIMMNFVKSTAMEQRVYLAKQQVMDWIDGNDTQSSVSIRMEMWKASIKQVNTHLPLTGVGYRNINPVIAKQADKKAQSQIARYNHVHNVYLNHLVSEGVFGLIAVLALLLFPLREFMSRINSKENDLDSISTMGMLLVVCLSLFGVTNHLFGDVFLNAFYVFFMAILLPKVARVNLACYKCGASPR